MVWKLFNIGPDPLECNQLAGGCRSHGPPSSSCACRPCAGAMLILSVNLMDDRRRESSQHISEGRITTNVTNWQRGIGFTGTYRFFDPKVSVSILGATPGATLPVASIFGPDFWARIPAADSRSDLSQGMGGPREGGSSNRCDFSTVG